MLIFKCYTLYVIFEIIGYWLVLNWGDSLKFPSAGLNIFRNYQIQWNHKSKYLYENFNTTSFSTTVQYKSGHKRLNQASKAQQWKSLLNCCKTSKSFTTTEAELSPVRFHLHKGRTLSLRRWLKPIVDRYLRPVPIDQISASLVFADRGILCFDFLHQGLSSGAVPLDFVDFLCSGTNVTTTQRSKAQVQ